MAKRRLYLFVVAILMAISFSALPLNSALAAPGDFDDDGIADAIDLDDDNDGLYDSDEGLVCASIIADEFNGTFGTRTELEGPRNLQDPGPANSSGYVYDGTGGASGRYSVISQEGPGINAWWGFSGAPDLAGHTTGDTDDAFLAVNGSTSQGTFFEETITVTPGDSLSLSVWGANWTAAPQFPVISLRAYDSTGTILLAQADSPALQDETWMRSEVNFNTGANSQIIVRLINVTTGAGGNDFAIDDFAVRSTGGPSCSTVDTDGDGHPDYQDKDSDNDGLTDNFEAQGPGLFAAPSGDDADNDGLDDQYDNSCSLNDSGGVPGNSDECLTAGFTPGTSITALYTDEDSRPDYLDLDSDDDGIPDNLEAQATQGYLPPSGTDSDSDGLDDAYELGGDAGLEPENTDGTDEPDYLDQNSDNEGSDDTTEAGLDLSFIDDDNDGLDDAYDATPTYAQPNGTIGQLTSLPNLQDPTTPEVDFREAVIVELITLKEQSSQTAEPGQTHTYTITVQNTGDNTAYNIGLADDLTDVLDDADYNYDAVISVDGTIEFTEPSLDFTINSLEAGQTATITYSVTTKNPRPADANHVLVNQLAAPGCPEDPEEFEPSCQAVADVPPAPYMTVSKTAPTDPLRPGDTLTYNVTATNIGDATVSGYHLIDDLTDAIDDAIYNNDAVASTGTVNYENPTISWTGTLEPGETVNISYSVTVKSQPDGGNGLVINSIIDPEVLSNCGPESSDDDCATSNDLLASSGQGGTNNPPASQGSGSSGQGQGGHGSGQAHLADTGTAWAVYAMIAAAALTAPLAVSKLRRQAKSGVH